MTQIRKPNFHAGKVVAFALGEKIAEQEAELTSLRTALATAEAERDAAHNEALEKAAEVAEVYRNGNPHFMPGQRISDLIRTLKKETSK